MSKLDKFLITLFWISNLAGNFSLARFGAPTDEPSLLSEVRLYLFAGLFIICVILLLFKKWRRPNAWMKLIILFFLYMASTFLWSENPPAAFRVSLDFLLLILDLGLAFFIFQDKPELKIRFLLALVFWTAVIYALAGLTGYWQDEGRMVAFWGGPNVFIRILGMGIIAFFFFWVRRKKMIWLLVLPLFMYCAIMSGSRGGILSLMGSVPLLIFVIVRFYKFRTMVYAIGGIFLLTLAMFVLPQTRGLKDYWNSRFVDLTFEKGSSSGRNTIFSESRDIFMSHPFLGAGVDGYRQHTWTKLDYSHNLFLAIISEGGIVGLFLFMIPFGFMVARIFSRRNIEHRFSFILGAFILMASQFSGYYFDTRLMWVFFLCYLFPADERGLESRVEGMSGNAIPSQVIDTLRG